ncbi:MAG: hydrogenase expression/formation protein HypE [Caldilineaceae bacterium]|nr:hydrogenase expression/formation protein HypE [Caldilineaceae bacterium]
MSESITTAAPVTVPTTIEGWSCPLPLRNHPNIIMGHGGGGKLSAELVQHLFLPAFQNEPLANLSDSAVLTLAGQRLAFSTDSFVVQPLFFPGGNIGDLAINGTVNDIAMSGAQPLFLSCGFILEEGMSLDQLGVIVRTMAEAARTAGVSLVTGDTKVVDRGHGDGVYINTSGIGLIPADVNIAPHLARPGDVVIVSGEIGLHGIAVMSVRAGLTFDTAIMSDCAPLHSLVASMLATTPNIHVLRDPTRGGVASSLNEIAQASQVGIVLEERKLPVPAAVRAACELLGLDPLYVANEGKLLAILPKEAAEPVLAAMHAHPLGKDATIIGEVVDQHPGMVVARTIIGGKRVVDMQVGEQLPRIC